MRTLFFDLDGTLIDSAVGITRCIAHALERMGHPALPEAELRGWIGPALRVSFGRLFADAADIERAVALYRERFEVEGWREHAVYPGIGETVEALHAAGHRLAVVTAKNEPHARRIVAHLPFGGRFEDIVGATECGRISHKPQRRRQKSGSGARRWEARFRPTSRRRHRDAAESLAGSIR